MLGEWFVALECHALHQPCLTALLPMKPSTPRINGANSSDDYEFIYLQIERKTMLMLIDGDQYIAQSKTPGILKIFKRR
jgi:hypothetical protein